MHVTIRDIVCSALDMEEATGESLWFRDMLPTSLPGNGRAKLRDCQLLGSTNDGITWHSSCRASVMCAGVSVCSFMDSTASPTSAAVLPGDSCRTRRNASRARAKSPSWN